MANDERARDNWASLAGTILSGEKKPTTSDARKLAGSALTQAPHVKR
jgi:hypothetical protein